MCYQATSHYIMRSIKSLGFNKLEIQLLEKQIKAIDSRLSDKWKYLGEGTNADIVLSKDKVTVLGKSKLVLVGNHHKSSNLPSLDLPIHLMQLIDLLKNTSEGQNSSNLSSSDVISSNASALYDLISEGNDSKLLLECPQGPVIVDPKGGLIHYDFDNLKKLIDCLAKTDSTIFLKEKNRSPGTDLDLKSSAPTNKVLWQLAKTEKIYSESKWANTHIYKLLSWPTVKEWDNSPFILKLALLFSRNFTSIKHASKFCLIEPIDVKIFLHCCQSVGVEIIQSENDDAQPEPAQEEMMIENTESSGWLHKKIKGILNHRD